MKGGKSFVSSLTLRFGDGRSVSFWVHKLCGFFKYSPLQNLYRISCQREMTVIQVPKKLEGEVFWDLCFKRNLHAPRDDIVPKFD